MQSQWDRLDDECRTSQITLLPDGRICVFGMSKQLLAVFEDLGLGGEELKRRSAQARDVRSPECRRPASRPRVAKITPGKEERS